MTDGNPTMLREFRSAAPSTPRNPMPSAPVVTNLSVHIEPFSEPFSDCDRERELDLRKWYRMEKDLCLHKGLRKAWLYLELSDPDKLTAEDFVVTDIKVGVMRPLPCSNGSWTVRDGGISVRRQKFIVELHQVVTAVDVLFGEDAVDPRPQWVLLQSPLQLGADVEKPSAKLTFLRGRVEPTPDSATELRVSKNGKFRIVQISDMHLTTGVGTCDDAMEKDGTRMGRIRADQQTLSFVGTILDRERPNLVVCTGDQLHHDIDDSQTAIFKATACMIIREIPWTIVFGNHDDEGPHASSRKLILSSESYMERNNRQ